MSSYVCIHVYVRVCTNMYMRVSFFVLNKVHLFHRSSGRYHWLDYSVSNCLPMIIHIYIY